MQLFLMLFWVQYMSQELLCTETRFRCLWSVVVNCLTDSENSLDDEDVS